MAENSSSRELICPDCGEVYPSGRGDKCPEDGVPLQEMAVAEDGDDDPLVGHVLERRFSIGELVGEGSMARVYRATQLSVHREVAVKVLDPGHSSDEVIVERFYREAQIISEFSHPNIVQVFDFGQDEELEILYLAMEYVDGYPLQRLVERGRFLPELAVEIGVQVAGALAEVHSHGVVHRDLKPENLMLVPRADGELEVKLLDFGIAHALKQADGFTEPGTVWGTPNYLSPEQAESEEVGGYSDIYSLGILLFEMLTGRTPTSGEKTMEILYEHVEGDLVDIRAYLEEEQVCDDLVELIRQMLATEPSERPQYALQVRERLRAIVEAQEYDACRVDPSQDRESMFSPLLRPSAPSTAGSVAHTPPGRPRVETSRGEKRNETSESGAPEEDAAVPAAQPAREDPGTLPSTENDRETGTEPVAGPSGEASPTRSDDSAEPSEDDESLSRPFGRRTRILTTIAILFVGAGTGIAVNFWSGGSFPFVNSETDAEAAARPSSQSRREETPSRTTAGASGDESAGEQSDSGVRPREQTRTGASPQAGSVDAGRDEDGDQETLDNVIEAGNERESPAARREKPDRDGEESTAPAEAPDDESGPPDPSEEAPTNRAPGTDESSPSSPTSADRNTSGKEEEGSGGAVESEGTSGSEPESNDTEDRVDPGLYPVE